MSGLYHDIITPWQVLKFSDHVFIFFFLIRLANTSSKQITENIIFLEIIMDKMFNYFLVA
jgi:hypothetical protein